WLHRRGRRISDGGHTTGWLRRDRGRSPARVTGSWEPSVALSGVTDQSGPEREDPGEAGGHGVAVGVAGDEMVGQQARYRLVEVTGREHEGATGGHRDGFGHVAL